MICFKRILSAITASVMAVTAVSGAVVGAVNTPTNAVAEPYSYSADNDYSVEGENSFGMMLADEINAEITEQQENNGFNVFSVEMDGKTASVELEALSACSLIVGIYSEDGSKLIATGNASIAEGNKQATVTIETDTMPQYYYLKAYLVDSVTMRPMCTVYESPNYTQEMQEFFAKTVNDFEEEKVLNLDDSIDNNFAVFNDEVIIIPYQSGINTVVTADSENGIYVINNANSYFTSLKSGDSFAYEYEENTMLIVTVATVSINGSEVTITESDSELEEVFDYVKIDSNSKMDQTEFDPEGCDEGVTHLGRIDDYTSILDDEIESDTLNSSNITTNTKADINIDVGEVKLAAEMFDLENTLVSTSHEEVKIEGKAAFSVGASLKINITPEYGYFEAKISYGVALNFSVSGEGAFKFGLGKGFTIHLGVCVKIKLKPTLILELSAKITFQIAVTGEVGFYISTVNGFNPILKKPEYNPKIEIEGSLFFGIDFSPTLEIIHDKIAKATMEAKAGVEITGNYEGNTEVCRHECEDCTGGEVSLIIDISAEAKFLNCNFLKLEGDLLEARYKICDWHYSKEDNKFYSVACPNKSYQHLIYVVNSAGNPLVADVVIDGNSYTTDAYGKLKIFLTNGEHSMTISQKVYTPKTMNFKVNNAPGGFTVHLNKRPADTSNNSDSGSAANKVKQVIMGFDHSAALMEDGSLYMWGANYFGQLGDGTTIDRNTPVKIKDNVVAVSLGIQHSACINADGILYTWGYNNYGQLGTGDYMNRYKPDKVLDNISSVELGRHHSAAITTDGTLYMWGCNDHGQLGIGSTLTQIIPTIVTTNITSVSLGYDHSAALTSNGVLLMWGGNDKGQLGNGNNTDTYEPIEVYDNVKSVSLGYYHSAAITKDNVLYTWGGNPGGQLGDNTIIDSNTRKWIKNDVAFVSIGGYHSACITTNGTLYTWGWNGDGQLGNGTTTDSYIPKEITTDIKTVNLGGWHSAAIGTDGFLYMWGENLDGRLGDGTTENKLTPTKITIPTATASTSAINASVKTSSPAEETFIPNEIYNIYGMKSRTADEPFSADNLLFITQVTADSTGKLTYDYQPDEECVNPVIFAKAMTAFEVNNAQITKAASGSGKISLEWTAADGADMYKVYRVVNGIYLEETTTTATSYTVTGLTNGTEYGFMVASRVNGEWSYISENDVVYATPQIQKPTITKAAPSDGKVALNWTAVDGASKYAVYTYVSGKWTCAGTRTELGMYVDGLTNGVKYGFAVKAYVNGAWTEVTSADIVYATPVGASKPKITSVEVGDGKIGLNWTSVSGAAKYAVYVNSGSGWNCAGTRTALGMYVNGLTNGTKYGFAVKAYVNNAWTSVTSSDIVYATPVSASKPKITKAIAGNGKVALNWTAVNGAEKYAIYTYVNGKYTCVGSRAANVTGMYVTGLTNGTKYGFLVRAYINGAWSSFTTADIVYATPSASATAAVISLY